MQKLRAFAKDERQAFETTSKIGLLATVSPEGLPHITFLNTLQAIAPDKMIFGQFTFGTSKMHIRKNPKTAFLILTMDRKLWRGKALYTHFAKEGPEYELLNGYPMFRYNTYFGISTVYYLDLVEHGGRESLPLASIIPASLLTQLVKARVRTDADSEVLKPWAKGLFNGIATLKFLSYIGEDGFPVLVPLMQCSAADTRRLAFSPLAYGDEIRSLPKGTPIAVLAVSMQMESVLVRGAFGGYGRRLGVNLGTLDIDWIYNSMPPKHGQIYPPVDIKPVATF